MVFAESWLIDVSCSGIKIYLSICMFSQIARDHARAATWLLSINVLLTPVNKLSRVLLSVRLLR
jgi:hypothetical protein